MALFRRRPEFDRTRILAAASVARLKKRRHRAIALYRQVLLVEPRNRDLHEKLAPLLAETGQEFDAWMSFRFVAQTWLRERHIDQALHVYREASRCLPREARLWEAISQLQRQQGVNAAAVSSLREGSRQLRFGQFRPQAIYLLRRAREIAPWDPDTILDLVRLLARTEQREEALLLLRGLISRVEGRDLRRARAAQFQVHPTVGSAWRWLMSALASGRESGLRPGIALPSVRR